MAAGPAGLARLIFGLRLVLPIAKIQTERRSATVSYVRRVPRAAMALDLAPRLPMQHSPQAPLAIATR